MKRYWTRAAARIDEMSLRQRAMLFAAVSLVIIALAHASLIEPLLVKQKALIDRVNRDQSQLTAARAQLQVLLREGQADPKDPDQALLLELERRVADVERNLASRKDALVAPARLPALLKELLGRNRQVRLEALRVVPGAAMSAPAPAGQEARAELYRHGVEITLKGTYFDLMRYLAELERAPARLLWGSAELQVEQHPEVRLILQVHTLSTQRALTL